ncbi:MULTISPECIES: LysR substrate-binding domain-containing protein [Brenneria]|uniref:LysR family transcriptional regulator n=1 Tax=Brenneria nigrifluens DSM 30175 = ATCC 13028 TaxID=1121120 RepID=A0A2U1UVL3_9GAMM|nr:MULTISPECIES: LysR substrate-binding domain-containing protein [Brenneria]EHD20208.1 transcriptional regulator, LysR family [Brenneria sp. EniD312]PWC25703.1 LysR family transcriptional regulator [Brenneria nigrifluens DSM 30175 = ATCC 13028]QCR03433.1 LysR family transcriptional regulator [Brenneria nigrifluens DSM 30175 = ATCC 13028]
MDSLNGLVAFVRAAQSQSFVAAAERIGISASAVGKSVARLEEKLNVRLFNRSTRRISLTDEGQLFFERCQHIVAQLEEAEQELVRISAAPRGKLRITAPAIGYRMLLPHLPEFRQRYPEVELDLDFSDRMVDMINEGFDIAIRSGELLSSQMMSRRLGPFRFVIVGSPAYFADRPPPQTPQALQHHACLRYRFPNNGQWQEWDIDDASPVALPLALSSNNLESLLQAALQGLGIAYVPEFIVRDYLASGELISVLAPYLKEAGKFSVVWPSSRHMLPKVRVFIDFLSEKQVLG